MKIVENIGDIFLTTLSNLIGVLSLIKRPTGSKVTFLQTTGCLSIACKTASTKLTERVAKSI